MMVYNGTVYVNSCGTSQMSGDPIIKTGLKKKHQESLPRSIEFVSLQIVQLRFWCVLQGSSQGQSRSAMTCDWHFRPNQQFIQTPKNHHEIVLENLNGWLMDGDPLEI